MKTDRMKIMKTRHTLLAAGLIAAFAAGPLMAQSAYYDPVQDVMVPSSAPSNEHLTPDSYAPRASTYELVIRNGQLMQGPQAIVVEHGQDVILAIDSEHGGALQIEGYDLNVALPAGQAVVLKFKAEQPGSFRFRLAGRAEALGVLEVGPASPQAYPAG